MMKKTITFEDVLISPKFSTIGSRAECSTAVKIAGIDLDIPIISANMDTVTEESMAEAMHANGGLGVLHRFCSLERNVGMFNSSPTTSFISVGITSSEKDRVDALYKAGARNFCVDVAHAASMNTVDMYRWMTNTYPNIRVMIGNFATLQSIDAFLNKVGDKPVAVKVGIGGGSMCTTREVTGVGVPQLSALMSIYPSMKNYGIPVISDGGHKKIGDICKALAFADAVMLGGMLAGTTETPGDLHYHEGVPYKSYRGSASKESYEVQGKVAEHRTAEGESTLIRCKGSVNDILQSIKAGIKSAMSYVGARDLNEYKKNVEFMEISGASYREGQPHGK